MQEKAQDRIAFDLQPARTKMEMRQDRVALDRALISARTFDDDGHMHVADNPISKATVNPYRGVEIPGWEELGLDPDQIYRLLRDPEELEKAAASFDGKPLLLVHKAIHSADHDHAIVCGTVGAPYWDAPYLKAKRLTVWTDEARKLIEDETQRELSSAYRYRPDMTPGSYKGERYDGVMRDISGSHVALVKEGRAGPDVLVGDELPETLRGLSMRNAGLSRASIGAPIALAVLMKPKLAADAKIDWAPTFKGVTAKNFKSSKARIAEDIKRQAKGKLAKDADLDDVVELLDKLEDVIPGEGPDVEFKKIDDLDPDDPPAEDEDDTEKREKLKAAGFSDEQIDAICTIFAAPAVDSAPSGLGSSESGLGGAEGGGPSSGGGSTATFAPVDRGNYGQSKGMGTEDKRAMDELKRSLATATSKIAAMDAKIAKARSDGASDAIRTQREIFSAINFVKPWIGESHAFDSADNAADVYRLTLIAMDEKDVDDLPEKAMRRMIEKMPKPGDDRRQNATRQAMDAAGAKSFNERFGTDRIGHA